MAAATRGWEFWIDRGGTFTDIVARAPDGTLITRKWLSENPSQYPDAALHGIGDILRRHHSLGTRAAQVDAIKMGTTVGTNALLQRTGEPTLLITNRGFGDALRIGYQNRPEIFALHIRLPDLLYERSVEIGGRMDARGREIEPLATEAVRDALVHAFRAGLRSVAVALLHSLRNPAHELAVGRIAADLGFPQVSLSHQASPIMRWVGRGNTTVLDAYLSPVLRKHVDRVASGLGDLITPAEGARNGRLSFMQSHGGLTDANRFSGKDSLLSGPAGGIIGAIATSRLAGFERIVTFDMGGTSTDVAHYAGTIERLEESEVAGIRVHLPLMDIHTIAAGGGSILRFDGQSYKVGPESAGASPGPACYRQGGPLCVTDANVLVGRLHPDFFPRVFGPHSDQSLDTRRVREAFASLADQIEAATGRATRPEAAAEGFLQVASASMANAIKKISVERGHDLADHALCCFGAAGGQHACPVAELLGISTILVHPLAGVLSAYGMGLAEHRVLRASAVATAFGVERMGELDRTIRTLEQEGETELRLQGIAPERVRFIRRLVMRYAGTDTPIAVPWEPSEPAIRMAFADIHLKRFGFCDPARPLVAERLEVEAIGVLDVIDEPEHAVKGLTEAQPAAMTRIFKDGSFRPAPIFLRSALTPGTRIEGPAIVAEETSTTVIDAGWEGEISRRRHLVLRRHGHTADRNRQGDNGPDPVMLEIFGQTFMAIAEQMGHTLQQTAHSVNIKERLDFSCAVFDRAGDLIANAPHIPVHLGSMGDSVKGVIQRLGPSLRPGEVYLTNSPYRGGTHLPDITVVTPVYLDTGDTPAYFVASRGHHADIGGITPGSMPPHSRSIFEEGMLSDGLRIVSDSHFDEEAVRAWLRSGPHPARNPSQNIADLRAQVAANEKGAAELRLLAERHSDATVTAYMGYVQDQAETVVRDVIGSLSDGVFSYRLDDGAVIRVRVTVEKSTRSAIIDFSGTSPQQPSNLNAPAAVCRAAVLYVFRTLARRDIPLNAGCLRPLTIVIPPGCMLNPEAPAAVVAGNVETSQYIVDALYGALGAMAASQGTMNNVTFGDQELQYYETICGGAGAGPGFDGCDAVHTHMTNSRITDPEVLESRFPVRLEEFSIRRHSGGAGRQRGGNGVIRRIRFSRAMSVSVLSSHRVHPPFGIAGGQPGATGCNTLQRMDGQSEALGGNAIVNVEPGDVLIIATPGGGGYGAPDLTPPD